MSSIRFAPLTGHDEAWKRLRQLSSKVLIFVGTTDPIIVHDELRPDAEALLGKENIEWCVIEGAHDFPVTESKKVTSKICEFWGI
jgi:surfactin synthase thioesterase subunit